MSSCCRPKQKAKGKLKRFELAFLNLCEDLKVFDEKQICEKLDHIWESAQEAQIDAIDDGVDVNYEDEIILAGQKEK